MKKQVPAVATPKAVKKILPQKCDYSLIDDFVNTSLEYLYDGKVSSGTKLASYVSKLFKPLNQEDESKQLALYNTGKLIEILEWLQENVDKRRDTDRDFARYMIHRKLFQWQKEVFNDSSDIITILCGRRSGKTYVEACKLVDHCISGIDKISTPDGGETIRPRQAVYVGLTKDKSKEIVWPVLTRIIEEARIPIANKNASKLSITFPNGNSIFLEGNADTGQQEVMRGLDASLVIIDEAQSQKGLRYLLDSILMPMISARKGQLILAGTSPLTARTLWEDYIKDEKVSHYSGITMLDVPGTPPDALQQVLEKYGWTESNINFRREYLAEIAYDTSIMVYPTRTYFDDSEVADFRPVKCYIGLDYGYRDCTAFAPVLIDKDNNMMLAHEFKQSGMSATAKIAKAKEIYNFIKATYKIDDVWFIQDHNEQDVGADIFAEGVEHVVNANKRNEVYQISLVRDCLESGRLRIKQGDYFDQECDRLVWQKDDKTDTILYKLDDKTYHGDISDAVRYAVGMVVPYTVGEDN